MTTVRAGDETDTGTHSNRWQKWPRKTSNSEVHYMNSKALPSSSDFCIAAEE